MIKNEIFGSWVNNFKTLALKKEPFDHLVIDNFFKQDFAESIYQEILNIKVHGKIHLILLKQQMNWDIQMYYVHRHIKLDKILYLLYQLWLH